MNLPFRVHEYLMITHRENTSIRKKQIINAARSLILKYGSDTVTVKRIATQVGVSEGAIYRHFESKNAIFSSLLDDIETTLIQESSLKVTNDPLGVLEDMLLKQIASIKHRKSMSFEIIAEIISIGDKKLNRKAYVVINAYIEQIQTTLADGVKSGRIRADLDIEAFSILLFGMIHGLVTVWTLSHRRINLEQKYLYLWDIYRQSISASPA
jgi:AcrR family transcriptional regulator